MTQLSSRKFYAVPPVLWAIIMLVLTLTPAKEMPHTPDWKLLAFDTAAHAGVFAVLAVLSWVALRQQRRWPALAQRPAMPVLIGSVLFGGLIEILQYLMAVGRQAEWSDLVGDSLGAALALLLVSGGWHWWSRRQVATPLVLLLLLSSSLFFAHSAKAQSPNLGRAHRTIEALAAPKLHGRGYVQGGEHKAAAYLRGRLRQLGLQPLALDFTQPFTLDVNTFPGKMELRLSSQNRSSVPALSFTPGIDFIVSPESPSTTITAATLIPADTAALHGGDAKARELLAGYLDRKLNQFLVLSQRAESQLVAPSNADLLARWERMYEARIVLVNKLTASMLRSRVSSLT
ncbi:VanZ family protein [Hymenobacter sp. BT559]|uniref:VanZ family protein n=1 Tax=Hymenobacter sp. BT559 TaxID=2795729 RepID=UPI0018EB34FE|nr:VanZ family protein [Hymenobacter sp. BT559]MBJ6143729.1 VanZ family protein [Hymenobacter sp. BT559]